jgi:hypothetical protein
VESEAAASGERKTKALRKLVVVSNTLATH